MTAAENMTLPDFPDFVLTFNCNGLVVQTSPPCTGTNTYGEPCIATFGKDGYNLLWNKINAKFSIQGDILTISEDEEEVVRLKRLGENVICTPEERDSLVPFDPYQTTFNYEFGSLWVIETKNSRSLKQQLGFNDPFQYEFIESICKRRQKNETQ